MQVNPLDRADDFLKSVEIKVAGGAGYLDAITQWCLEEGYEMEAVIPLVQKNSMIVSKLRVEAEDLNFLKKSARLPI